MTEETFPLYDRVSRLDRWLKSWTHHEDWRASSFRKRVALPFGVRVRSDPHPNRGLPGPTTSSTSSAIVARCALTSRISASCGATRSTEKSWAIFAVTASLAFRTHNLLRFTWWIVYALAAPGAVAFWHGLPSWLVVDSRVPARRLLNVDGIRNATHQAEIAPSGVRQRAVAPCPTARMSHGRCGVEATY